MAVCKRKSPYDELAPSEPASGVEHCAALQQADRTLLCELFGQGAAILLVGDGNLSFAGALARLGAGSRITATTFEDDAEHTARFASSNADAAQLRGVGARVAHGVDATDLAGTLPEEARGPFHRIIFQFPQHAERRKIQKHRELLRRFFASAVQLLEVHGEVVISLCRGQGGTAAEPQERRAQDSWQVQDAAAEVGLLLRSVQPCPITALAALGYRRTGFRGQGLRDSTAEIHQDRAFNADSSLTHVFCRDSIGAVAAFPLEYCHDVSFWTLEGFREERLRALVGEVCGPGSEQELKLLDEYMSPEGRRARTYRISLRSSARALSKSTWKHLCQSIRQQMLQADAAPRQA